MLMATNLKIAAVVVFTLLVYTLIANSIPQVESEVPEELDLSTGVTTEALVAAGERLYNGAGGCVACHGLGTRAPSLLTSEGEQGTQGVIGARCGSRVEGMSCKEYLYESLTEPAAYLLEGYSPIMPDMRRLLSQDQIWALIAFLESQGGEVTVTAEDLARGSDGSEAESNGSGGTVAVLAEDPKEMMTSLGCFACHQLGGEGNAIGPALDGIGSRNGTEYIRRSILDPAADITSGYEAFAAMMPATFGDQLSAAQLEALVTFLAAQK